MILTVTMNPSVDISYPMETFQINHVNRVTETYKTAGGKGLNVARVIEQLTPGNVITTGILGGTVGDFIIKELQRISIKQDFLITDKESRNCIAILHDGKQTEILESGPVFGNSEGKAFLELFDRWLLEVDMVTISGSLPKGLSVDFYQKMLEMCEGRGVPAILDTSNAPLKEALSGDSKPFVIKPNLEELSRLLGKDIPADSQSLLEALNDNLFSGIECIVASLGSQGAFVKYGEAFYRVTVPAVEIVSPVGSGDATVAGLAVAFNKEKDILEVIKTAMTTGVLNTLEKQTGVINPAIFNHYYEKIKVDKLK